MDQLEKHSKSDPILDFSSTESLEFLINNKDISWPDDSVMKVNDNHILRGEEEEIMKIRHELEVDVERDLEEELKEGIYHLALRLNRLYQHRKERTKRENESAGVKFAQEETFSEVNINIKMEGGTKIEIKETKKNDHHDRQELSRDHKIRPQSSRTRLLMSRKSKKFDWVNSLRSDSGPVIMNKKIHGSQASMMSNEGGGGVGHRRQLQRGIISVNNDREPLDLGWKV
ncbi:hypothetical protein PanWU01x14_343360 [Parasponia andersonii]|uniref:Uncharacterized protein n=1 Tax=Parasponia andersonii TaxID=3476 RepID=A0A2P5ADD2_PARAD|nr:hypothetical protein PanWU01x14_343360 [Parasponia andersonii]